MKNLFTLFISTLIISTFCSNAISDDKKVKYKTSDFYDESTKEDGKEETPKEEIKGLLYESTSLYTDIKPREYKEHDIITVIIEEKANASISAATRTDKRTRVEALLENFIRLSDDRDREGKYRILPAIREGEEPEVDLDARVRRDNKGDMTRGSTLAFRIAAQVVQVLPNGNLVIEAKKTKKLNDETETLAITGTINPSDISRTDNSIKSEKVANVEIIYNGKGVVSETQKRNLLGKLIDFFFGF